MSINYLMDLKIYFYHLEKILLTLFNVKKAYSTTLIVDYVNHLENFFFFDNNNKVTINHGQLVLLKQVILDFKNTLGLKIIGDISFENINDVKITPSFYLTLNNSLFKQNI